jgi:hypothetical protein
VWVTRSASRLAALAGAAAPRPGDRRLLVLGAIDEITHHVLAAWFRYVVSGGECISLLKPRELFEALQAPNRSELFVGGAFDARGKVVVLYRGSLQPLVVPLDWFKKASDDVRPDPKRLRIIDHGQTIGLGEFEAAADAILYEFDEEYRRAAKKRLIGSDRSLGGSIRRLRLQRGLRRGDFASVPSRTIARIEGGEVRRPQRSTLEKIAARLRVPVDTLETY